MAIVNCVNTKATSKAALKKIINYVLQEEKTDELLVSGKDLMPESAYAEMVLTKKEFNKTGGRQYLHMIQSFSPDEPIDHQTAHEIALKLAEHYEGFQVLIATHKDREHIHSHLIINSVNFETGLKIQQSFKQLNEVMDKSDAICREYGLSVIEDRKFGKHIDRNEYHIAMKGESWKMELSNTIDDAMKHTRTKNEFITEMNSRGYDVNWSETRKYITYTTPEGLKCRSNKLHDETYTKEAMEHVYNGQNERSESRNNHDPASGENHRAERLGADDENTLGRDCAAATGNARADGNVPKGIERRSTRAPDTVGASNLPKHPGDREDHGIEDVRYQRQVPGYAGGQSGAEDEAGEHEADYLGAGLGADGLLDIAHHLSLVLKDDDRDSQKKHHNHKKSLDSWEEER